MNVHQLVYHSRSLFHLTEGGPLDTIRRILSSSNRNNTLQHITGCLIIDDKCIMQILEGKAERIFSLFKIIEADSRHADVNLVDFQSLSARNFSGWSMAGSVRTHMDDKIYQAHGIFGPTVPATVTPQALIRLSQDLLHHHHA